MTRITILSFDQYYHIWVAHPGKAAWHVVLFLRVSHFHPLHNLMLLKNTCKLVYFVFFIKRRHQAPCFGWRENSPQEFHVINRNTAVPPSKSWRQHPRTQFPIQSFLQLNFWPWKTTIITQIKTDVCRTSCSFWTWLGSGHRVRCVCAHCSAVVERTFTQVPYLSIHLRYL